jgi:glycosyltransferase involved in cell wall biosynthesis
LGEGVSSLQTRNRAKELSNLLIHDPALTSALEQPRTPRITILLCTFNGERFLAAQLASIEQQTHWNWHLIVSDDGSTDSTLTIIQHFAQRVSQPVEIRSGPRRGPAANFVALAADTSIEGECFAFCDQDDVWHANKLTRALEWIENTPGAVPAVYGARTRIVSEAGVPVGHAPRFTKSPCFANALAQSIAGGNTMLFNVATKRLFEKAGPVRIVSHDWWAYQLVTGSGGAFRYDSEARIDYRQHANNRIGTNRGLRAFWKRFRMVIDGGFAVWNDLNLAALRQCRHLLTEDARALLDAYETMRHGDLLARLRAFAASGIRRQTLLGTAALLLAVVLKKA